MRGLVRGHLGYLGTVVASTLAARGHAVVGLDSGLFEECRLGPAVLSARTGWCAAQGALADAVQVARRSLEDVFLERTGRELRP